MEVIRCEDSSDVIGDGTSGLARFASLQSLESFFFFLTKATYSDNF